MSLVVDILQLLLNHVGVYLCGGDIRMAQHLLDGAQIRPVLQQMGGKGVAEGMGRDVLLDPCLFPVIFHDLPEALAAHEAAAAVDEKPGRVPALYKSRAGCFQIS